MNVMLTMEQTEELKQYIFEVTHDAIAQAKKQANVEVDIVKQKYCAQHFQVSVNTLKEWIRQGAPEIVLDSGMVLYSKQAITKWLLIHQK